MRAMPGCQVRTVRELHQENSSHSSFAIVEPEASSQPPLGQGASMGEEKIIELSKCVSVRKFLSLEGPARTLSPHVVGDALFWCQSP